MSKRVQYRTEGNALICSTDFPNYATRKRAARKAKELGHSALYECDARREATVNISNYIE